ncbi:hypothetical protein C3709_20720 [Lelliottia aquatilis]|uniref:Uncharacterized protein n=1 Tax=Lelliottia aquatilis TaxID=2080838 RepID=A0ABX4ZVX3_9ENTR|nr:hypothetical protein C3712_21040 [Lelliottia aquatilis]POZ20994.1 hypothetical protein C3711_21360 [Lelliottia aquatilis]POZ24431.1 hypothetical protein C3708_14535 [Lelliottia sp. 7254-16]POZ30680.1 hypothetical protein C3710_21325 [Lelliottia aquatilis]POZ36372.1 hypothetical protein C3709_20720 [Lelliottia aquatilis]
MYHSQPSLFLFFDVDINAEDKNVKDCPNIMKLAIDQSLAKIISCHFFSDALIIIISENGTMTNAYAAKRLFKCLE